MTVGFALRAPWYVRERGHFDLRDPRALRPAIQMYDSTGFVDQLRGDPRVSLAFREDDTWSYPVPVRPKATAKGRERFATSKLVHTGLRKLYQPSHSRFYAVVVEVFCDLPGLPRAGSHGDIKVEFVMRRQHTTIEGDRGLVRRLARKLMKEMAEDRLSDVVVGVPDTDVRELWFAEEADRRSRFEEGNAALIEAVNPVTEEQAWVTGVGGGRWTAVKDPHAPVEPDEERFPMWRLPPRDKDCDAAKTRSLWFGVVPTYSAEHWNDTAQTESPFRPKLDDHAIYQLRCLVSAPPEPGHERCPAKIYRSEPTRPFRLAAAFDPDGTKNRTISITAPDLRRLAARAGQKQGPGGLRITTPAGSALGPVPFKKIPEVGIGGSPGVGSICTFAFELFFIVAFFLFLLFLPIVVFAFQLWWMLALRFCIPPSISFSVVAKYFAEAKLLVDLPKVGNEKANSAFNDVIGIDNAAVEMLKRKKPTDPPTEFEADKAMAGNLVAAMDAKDAKTVPDAPPHETTPADPLCT